MQTTDTQSITAPTKELTTKTIWRIVMVCIIVFTIMGLCSVGVVIQKYTDKSKYITITTAGWVEIDVSKKAHDFQIMEVEGVMPEWIISPNDTKHGRKLPLPSGEKLYFGYQVKKVYISLYPNQGITSAQMKVTLK